MPLPEYVREHHSENVSNLIAAPEDCWFHIYHAIRLALRAPGDLAECGAYLGQTSLNILRILPKTRTLHLFDTFTMLPTEIATEWEREHVNPGLLKPGNLSFYRRKDTHEITSYLPYVARKLAEFPNYEAHPGRFAETLPGFDKPLCFILSDGDLEQSTKDTIRLADRVLSPGGIILFHDYSDKPGWGGVIRAVDAYLDKDRYWLIEPRYKPDDAVAGIGIAMKHWTRQSTAPEAISTL